MTASRGNREEISETRHDSEGRTETMIQCSYVRFFFGIVLVLSSSIFVIPAYGQLGMFSKQQLVEFTLDWHGSRFADGRPDVSDSMLQRLQDVTAEQAEEVQQQEGYNKQLGSGWTG